ncbi:PREDICTED: prefoldin subunit 4-like [Amphimedon queenslandica]|uniref:Prefoldin subunit 4 n=1 Tax=Amphimedon queenslandica TaxID=400682 RepID=A0AAN0ID68_AMPQE|nr:PREDICTED: prefoldin subunit 4-like [Amphimedon queenslandica]|eukprot:XP_003385722.1 PREDICTED: prefoldin subunit 4-like [Amphimedon queenslandica]
MAAIPKGKGEIGKDMVVLFEDQQKINLFAKKNSLLNDIKDQITEKERIFKNVEDAADELILFDDDQMVPYEIGEVFVLLSLEEAQQKLEDYKLELQKELDKLKEQASSIEELLSKVKSQLYAKFGDNINLEADS